MSPAEQPENQPETRPCAPAPATEFPTADTTDVDTMSYEQAREELVTVVQQLEAGGAALEESLALWQRGEALANRCEQWLDGAQVALAEVRQSLNGEQTEDSARE